MCADLPHYLKNKRPSEAESYLSGLIQSFFRFIIWITLRPRIGSVGNLDEDEIKRVYRKEAKTYDAKHHRTTRGQDTVWRRRAGWFVASHLKAVNFGQKPRILDLCTGTGLTLLEISRVLRGWFGTNFEFEGKGIDISDEMLEIAKARINLYRSSSLEYIKANALEIPYSPPQDPWFDFVVQVFGIGGIAESQKVFREVLRVLRPGGFFYLVDMHAPIKGEDGEWPFFGRWLSFPNFETESYRSTTVPLVLNRLWGWRDPTKSFYQLPLSVWQDQRGQWWGFEIDNFNVESERWWLGLPLMPIGTLSVKKTQISESEAICRSKRLDALDI